MGPEDLHAALKRYWGYDTFRPMQERIIQSLLAGHDVFSRSSLVSVLLLILLVRL